MLYITEKTRIKLGIPADCGILIKKQGVWMIEEEDLRKCDPEMARLFLGSFSEGQEEDW
jgi:hypothetical protein